MNNCLYFFNKIRVLQELKCLNSLIPAISALFNTFIYRLEELLHLYLFILIKLKSWILIII